MKTRLEELRQKLDEIETRRANDDAPGQTDEYRRQIIIQAASEAADELIMEGSDGSVEETDFLTSAVAQVMNNRVHQANMGRLLRKQLFGNEEGQHLEAETQMQHVAKYYVKLMAETTNDILSRDFYPSCDSDVEFGKYVQAKINCNELQLTLAIYNSKVKKLGFSMEEWQQAIYRVERSLDEAGNIN